MTVSSGFFNSINHDRLYDADQLSSMFDGIIIDGVYENYGDAFNVTALSGVNNTVLVGTGRAWFNHTWTLNDSIFSITLDPPNEMLGRIDAIVIDVNKESGVRKNSIIYIKGDEASPDFPPTLINTENHHQYPIAYITRHAEQNGPISQSDIQITVGTDACPIVTGVLESQNLENLMQQLDTEFREWWDGIKDLLDENTVTNLQNQIDEINEKLESDTALVGLLQKPVAEAFMSGDYGLDVSSYNAPLFNQSGLTLSLHDNISFLSNGEVCSVGFEFTRNYVWVIHVQITGTNGVSVDHTEQIPTSYIPAVNDQSFYKVAVRVFPLESNTVNGYPATFKYAIFVSSGYDYTLSLRIMTVQVSSAGTIGITYSDATSASIPVRMATVSAPGNTVLLPDGSRIISAGLSQVNDEYYFGYWVCRVSSDGLVINNKLTTLSTSYNSTLINLLGSGSNYGVWHYIDGKVVEFIPDSMPRIDSSNGSSTPSDTGQRIVIEPETLDASLVSSGYSLPSRLEYTVNYGVETYSLSEQNGVMAATIEAGGPPDIVNEKISPYFIGATNLMSPLPEGTFIAAKDPNGCLYGIASTGEQIAIGTNGGAAILKTKKTVNATIDISKVVVWLKGYYISDDFTGYLLFTGTTNMVYPYTYVSMGATQRTGTVVKISKGV